MQNNKLSIYLIAMIAEIDLVIKNLINIFFMNRYLGSDGGAAYEIVMPCIMVASAVVALGYNGVQTVCAKDYGAKDQDSFSRHKNAGYSWMLLSMAVITCIFALFKGTILDMLGGNDGSATLAKLSDDCYSMFLFNYIPQGLLSIACCLMFFEERRRLLTTIIIHYSVIILCCIIVTLTGPSMIGYITATTIGIISADIYIVIYCFFIRRRASLSAMTAFSLKLKDFKDAFFTGLPDFMEYIFVAIFYLVENLYILDRFSESVVSGVSIFEAIDNIPELMCVGFCFLTTATYGTRVGRLIGASSGPEKEEASSELDKAAGSLTRMSVFCALAVSALLLILSPFLTKLFMTETNAEAQSCAILLTVSCALGLVFYILNSELVCYYKVVKAFAYAHIIFLAEALLLPLGFRLLLGEIFGITGFCLGGLAGEFFTFLLNICFVWKSAGHFPLHLSDFRMKKHLSRLTEFREGTE